MQRIRRGNAAHQSRGRRDVPSRERSHRDDPWCRLLRSDSGTARHRLDAISRCLSVSNGLETSRPGGVFSTLLTCKRVGVVHHSDLTTKIREMNLPLRTNNHDSEHRNEEQRCEYAKEKHDNVLCVVWSVACGVAACGVRHVARGVWVRGCVGVWFVGVSRCAWAVSVRSGCR